MPAWLQSLKSVDITNFNRHLLCRWNSILKPNLYNLEMNHFLYHDWLRCIDLAWLQCDHLLRILSPVSCKYRAFHHRKTFSCLSISIKEVQLVFFMNQQQTFQWLCGGPQLKYFGLFLSETQNIFFEIWPRYYCVRLQSPWLDFVHHEKRELETESIRKRENYKER